ncbi:hypothetical protein GCM10025863_32940 [Microbacterium suwonense]|uniref:Uncharacterized protein n=1 Tax=Microbacterium suwonense TaxID=683047 RepID=A0ABM8FY55_9MICO|nr:hypothetical protein GCM10025863_00300 [Microbacterium suwonense]BDZ40680.1 hypothetical protein GCM10025863_32940 [Microbacterium suwonense]
MSYTFSDMIVMVVSTTISEDRMPGTVTFVKRCQAFVPSSSAASICSTGTALIAADRMTIANPVWVQMKTISSMNVLISGLTASQLTGSPPNIVTMAFIRPSWSPCR